MKVIFANRFHNGDIHISRELVRKVMHLVQSEHSNVEFTYAHVNSSNLLSDIDRLGYSNPDILGIDQFENLTNRLDGTVFNTWYGQQNFKYMNQYAMTLDCLYAAFDDSCKALWKFSLSDISTNPADFIPTIDYSKFKIENAKTWLNARKDRKKVFVANGYALSGQATNFPMTEIILDLADKYKDIDWILSNFEGKYGIHKQLPDNEYPNVFHSYGIIGTGATHDLNENAFLSEHCDLIIGRASGAFSFAWTQENLLRRKCKFLAFCGPGVIFFKDYNFWNHELLHGKINYSAQITASHETDFNKVKSIIESHL